MDIGDIYDYIEEDGKPYIDGDNHKFFYCFDVIYLWPKTKKSLEWFKSFIGLFEKRML
jgi:hypothetical protein